MHLQRLLINCIVGFRLSTTMPMDLAQLPDQLLKPVYPQKHLKHYDLVR